MQVMDESVHGTRDRRGHYVPNKTLKIAPLYPPRWRETLAWLPSYFLPWNVVFAASAVLYWVFFIPPVEVLQTLEIGWILRLYVINVIAVALFYGAFEVRLYVARAQEGRFKFNPRFPSEVKSRQFWFRSQNVENILRTFLYGVTVWTLSAALMLWAWANMWGNWLSFAEAPIYLAIVALFVSFLHQAHFYVIHRLIHTPWLYKHVHAIHHKSVNPSPWSSLAMHPFEHVLYFASVFWHVLLPSHPLIALYQLHKAGFGAIPGHIGFEKIEFGEDKAIDAHAYGHYLHHKYFEVNYGDGLVPFDKLFGTYHDGTPEADAAMRARLKSMRTEAAPS